MSPGAAIDHWFDRVCSQPTETGYYLARRKLLAMRGETIEPLPTLESLMRVCPECGDSYLSLQALSAHLYHGHGIGRQVRNESRGVFPCPECGHVLANAGALGAHRKHSHGVAGSGYRAELRERHVRGEVMKLAGR